MFLNYNELIIYKIKIIYCIIHLITIISYIFKDYYIKESKNYIKCLLNFFLNFYEKEYLNHLSINVIIFINF